MRKAAHVIELLVSLAFLCLRCGWAELWPRKRPKEIRKVLVLGYSAVGDFIFLLPALTVLRRRLPDAHITFVADPSPIIDDLVPGTNLVNETFRVAYEDVTFRERRAIAGRLRDGRFDAVLMTLPTPAAHFALSLLSIPIRIGHCRPLSAPHAGWSALRYAAWAIRRALISGEAERRLVLTDKIWVREDAEHQVTRNLALIDALTGPAGEIVEVPRPEIAEPPAAGRKAEELLGKRNGGRVAVHIGSPKSQYGKIWLAEKWGRVCRLLSEGSKVRFVLLGGEDEEDNARRFQKEFGGAILNLVGRLSLLESFAVLRRCDLLLGNDTGLSKTAMAMGVANATVWGPSDRSGYGIFWDPDTHLEVYRELPCVPCVRMGLPAEGSGVINFSNCGPRACLAELSAEYVYRSIRAKYAGLF